jgi:two-component system response regulator YesN
MYKVMIVEDEEFILQGLCHIVDWDELGLKVVHKAQDGIEALDMWNKEVVDIVITDICMPDMGGLELLKKLREKSIEARFIILSGYDQFEYARQAIPLDVEEYIIKPIDEEKLTAVLSETIKKIDDMHQKKNYSIDELLKAERLLGENGLVNETNSLVEEWKQSFRKPYIVFANMRFRTNDLVEDSLARIVHSISSEERDEIRIIFTEKNELLLIESYDVNDKYSPREFFSKIQKKIENSYGFLTFVSVGPILSDWNDLAKAYKQTKKLQKYIIFEGYGSCIDESYINNRENTTINLEEDKLYSFIIGRDKDAAIAYLEDLFINNIKKNKNSFEVVYKMLVDLIIMLQKIKEEYEINKTKNRLNVSELLDEINRADDITEIKGALFMEVIEIIEILQIENSQYSPVVKQIMAKVKNNYKEDMSLKTLADKFNMNPSYLGQIFLKEVGCTFAQYLNHTRNKVGRDLILRTNMRMNDIATEIGYVDVSYFYRMFKKYYGVSPASLREIKKY